jgi:hypothetical protein
MIGPCLLCQLSPSKSYETLSTPSTHIYRLLLIQRGHLPSNPLRTAVRPHRDIFETGVDVLEASEHIGDLKSHQVSSQDPLLPSCSCPTACLSCTHPSLATPRHRFSIKSPPIDSVQVAPSNYMMSWARIHYKSMRLP